MLPVCSSDQMNLTEPGTAILRCIIVHVLKHLSELYYAEFFKTVAERLSDGFLFHPELYVGGVMDHLCNILGPTVSVIYTQTEPDFLLCSVCRHECSTH